MCPNQWNTIRAIPNFHKPTRTNKGIEDQRTFDHKRLVRRAKQEFDASRHLLGLAHKPGKNNFSLSLFVFFLQNRACPPSTAFLLNWACLASCGTHTPTWVGQVTDTHTHSRACLRYGTTCLVLFVVLPYRHLLLSLSSFDNDDDDDDSPKNSP